MREVLAHREGRRGKNPGAFMFVDVTAKSLADLQRRHVQHEAAGVGFEPLDHPLLVTAAIDELIEPVFEFEAAAPLAFQPLAAFGQWFQIRFQPSQRFSQIFDGRVQRHITVQRCPGRALGVVAQGQSEVAHGLVQLGDARLN